MAKVERDLGRSIIRTEEEGHVFLDELDPERGDHNTEPAMDCSLLCTLAEDAIAA